jgi:hypothetical protein
MLLHAMQIGAVRSPGHVVEWPKLAEGLDTGRGILVQWRLADLEPESSLGLVLTIHELQSRADALQRICESRKSLGLVDDVASTMEACTRLLSRCDTCYTCAVAAQMLCC